MDPHGPLLIPLDARGPCDEAITSGKAAKLAQSARAGFRVQPSQSGSPSALASASVLAR